MAIQFFLDNDLIYDTIKKIYINKPNIIRPCLDILKRFTENDFKIISKHIDEELINVIVILMDSVLSEFKQDSLDILINLLQHQDLCDELFSIKVVEAVNQIIDSDNTSRIKQSALNCLYKFLENGEERIFKSLIKGYHILDKIRFMLESDNIDLLIETLNLLNLILIIVECYKNELTTFIVEKLNEKIKDLVYELTSSQNKNISSLSETILNYIENKDN